MTLALRQIIPLPPHAPGGFDHADVHTPSGQVYVAHAAFNQIEILDGEHMRHVRTVPNCPESSGMLYVPEIDSMFAAARGSGQVLVLDAGSGVVARTLAVGTKPNGLAWDAVRQRLLVADSQDYQARIIAPMTGVPLAVTQLPGRPRWCVYDRVGDRFWLNIRDPSVVVVLAADTGTTQAVYPVPGSGPHGLALDAATGRLYVACDSGELVVLDRTDGHVLARVSLAGEPDVVWLNTERQRLYIAIGKPGLVQIVDLQQSRMAEEVQTEEGAHTLAFDEQRQRLYTFLPRSCQAAVYDEV